MSRNAYPGICYRCGKPCAAGDGHFEKVKAGPNQPKWRLQHASCAIQFRGTDVGNNRAQEGAQDHG